MNSIRVDIPLDTGLDLQDLLIQHPSATFFVRATGSSVRELGILSGDLLIVDRSLCPKNNSIVVAVVDGELLLQRYHHKTAVELWGVVTYAIHDVRLS